VGAFRIQVDLLNTPDRFSVVGTIFPVSVAGIEIVA
jgi:hypothetical protein